MIGYTNGKKNKRRYSHFGNHPFGGDELVWTIGLIIGHYASKCGGGHKVFKPGAVEAPSIVRHPSTRPQQAHIQS
jgi:hypothetical protein